MRIVLGRLLDVFLGALGCANVPILFFPSQADSNAAGCPPNHGCGSGDDVGRDLVFDERNAVAQQQLAFLQSL
jgi:hypothetical protein